jgi:hypothetical protein
MSKSEELSDAAKAATTTEDIWSLFITDDILDEIVMYTNQKIDEDILKAKYSKDYLEKNNHITHIDKVSLKEETLNKDHVRNTLFFTTDLENLGNFCLFFFFNMSPLLFFLRIFSLSF